MATKYITDEQIDAMTEEQKFNALEDFMNFDGIAEHVCNECVEAENCEGYFSGRCPCSGVWDDILTNMLKAQQDFNYARKRVIDYAEENPEQDLFPLTCIGMYDGHFCSVPYYG